MSDHYFSQAPASELKPREIKVELAGAPHQVLTAGGVFSPEHLDRGTELLLRTIGRFHTVEDPHSRRDAVLDLGCGWGPIALAAALLEPERGVWAVDINERARELTAENARRLGLTNMRVVSPDEVPAEMRFGEIHSNPPIRIGKQALHELLRLWLPRLESKGKAYLVVAKHLGADSLQKWISAEFEGLTVSRIARDKGFHVIEAFKE